MPDLGGFFLDTSGLTPAFHGEQGHEIMYGQDDKILIKMEKKRRNVLESFAHSPIGKQTWNKLIYPKQSIELKFSRCSEATCDDGNCVGWREWCNGMFDCDDRSDEIECGIVCPEDPGRKLTDPPIISGTGT